MKVEVSILERAFVANVLRHRAMSAKENGRVTKSDRQRAEFDEEARVAEGLAIRFDEGEPLVMTDSTPIIADPRKDLDYLDDTGGNRVT